MQPELLLADARFGSFRFPPPSTGQAANPEAPKPDEVRIKRLIEQLGAEDAEVREQAEVALLAIGPATIPFLQEAASRSLIPEQSIRAKALLKRLQAKQAVPNTSFAEAVPADTLLFFEVRNGKALQDQFKLSPLGKAWVDPATQAWWKKYLENEKDEDERKEIQMLCDIAIANQGRFAAILGSPQLINQKEINPPMVFVGEAPQAKARLLADLALRYFRQTGDTADGKRSYGPFQIEEHTATQSVFTEALGFYSLMPIAIETLLNGLLQPPKENLGARIAEAAGLLQEPEIVLHAARNGLERLVQAGHDLDEDLLKALDLLGFKGAGRILGAVKVVPEAGFDERYKAELPDATGLLSLLARLPPVPAADLQGTQPGDAIPPHAAGWFAIRGQLSAQAAPLAVALKALDKLYTLPVPREKAKAGQDPKTVLEKRPPEEPVQRRRWDRLYIPRIERVERLTGVPLDAILAQVKGGLELGLLTKTVGKEEPEDIPLGFVLSLVLKDTAALRQGFEKAVQAPMTHLGKEAVGDGTLYHILDDPFKPGYWVNQERLLIVTETKILSLALDAIAGKGAGRMAGRQDVKDLLAHRAVDEQARIVGYGLSSQLLDMPYRLGQITFNWDEETPWPPFKTYAALLPPFLVQVIPGVQPNEIFFRCQSPLTFLGMIEAFRRPLDEAGY